MDVRMDDEGLQASAVSTESADARARYFAFISYSHVDRRWADWLHRALETWHVPSRLVGQQTPAGAIPRRLFPIFRDREELASATDLGRTVEEALTRSANLIVICSPHAAASRWVDAEVRAFQRLGRRERIFCLIVDGEPNSANPAESAKQECFVPSLRCLNDGEGQFNAERVEPIAADARPGRDGKANAKLKLVAGLLGIDYDALKQRELHRRNRRLALITAAAVLLTTLTSSLAIVAVLARNAANSAREAAERRQKQAEDLVGFMLGNLNDKLAQMSRLDIMEAVDDKAMAYFQGLPASDMTDSGLAQRAKALEKIGVVRQEQGHLPAALESFGASARIAGMLADAMPQDATRQIAYSRSLAFVGMTHWNQGRLDEAQASFESARRALERAQPVEEKRPELLFQLTLIDNDIGHVLEARGRIDEAEQEYRSMLTRCERLVAGKNVPVRWRIQLGSAHNNLGHVALLRGDLAAAVAEYAADYAIEAALLEHDPKNNNQRANTMRVRAIYGRTLAMTGAVDDGMRELQAAVDISALLLSVDPGQAEFQEYAALYSSQLARLKRLRGDAREAATLNAHGIDIFTALTKQDTENVYWKREFAEAQTEQAAQALALGQKQAAQAPAQSALGALDALSKRRPDDRDILLALASARLLLADANAEAQARELRETALAALRAGGDGERDTRVLALRATALISLGRDEEARRVLQALWPTGYRDAALLAILQRRHIEYPTNEAFRQRVQAMLAHAASA